jgi:hypothetical protein
MKRELFAFALGVALLGAGALDVHRPQLRFLQERLLEYELEPARARGHAAEVLFRDVSHGQLRDSARTLSRRHSETVLALSADTALIVPSAADAQIASESSWSAVAADVSEPFLRNQDLQGAAAALVRRYEQELIERGILPALPPRRPIFLPDVTRAPDYPSESWLSGLGIIVLVLVSARLLEQAARRRTGG